MKQIKLVNLRNNDHALDEAYRSLRTNILFSGFDTKVISITSCDPGDGKSTTSFELAKSLSEAGKKVLLVDADMRRSNYSKKYTEAVDILGLSHYLSGQAQIADVLYSTDVENFYIVFSGVFPPNPAELLTGSVFTDFVAEAKQNFDYVIIDTPPLGHVTDAAICIAASDAAVMLVSSGKTKLKRAREVKHMIDDIGTKVIGCILNNVKMASNTRYYKYY